MNQSVEPLVFIPGRLPPDDLSPGNGNLEGVFAGTSASERKGCVR
jgi:hypothetical protein